MLRTARRAITTTLGTVVVAILVAMVAERCVAGVQWMIRWPDPADRWWWIVVVVGAVLSIVIVHRAHTTGETTAAFVRALDDPPGRLAPVPARLVATVAGVGLGTPLGLDGPALHLGGALGARAARTLGRNERMWTIAAGVAALSMVINAPIAAACFAFEIDRRRVPRVPDVMPLVAGAFAGWLVRRLSGDAGGVLGKAFNVPTASIAVPALMIGVVCGVAGRGVRIVFLECSKLRWDVARRVRVAGIALTLAVPIAWVATGRGIYVGAGGRIISWAESSTALPIATALAVLVIVMLALVAADVVGGLLIPMFTVGNLLGLLLARTFMPGTSTVFAVVVGGCAMVAVALSAPLTAVALGFSTLGRSAGSWSVAVAVLLAVAASGRRRVSHVRS